jgi:hypothetical protein
MMHSVIWMISNYRLISVLDKSKPQGGSDSKKDAVILREGNNQHIAAHTFTFRELAAATKNFRQDCLLGEGGFGRVYKGRLESGQVCDTESALLCWIFVVIPQYMGLSNLIVLLIKYQ